MLVLGGLERNGSFFSWYSSYPSVGGRGPRGQIKRSHEMHSSYLIFDESMSRVLLLYERSLLRAPPQPPEPISFLFCTLATLTSVTQSKGAPQSTVMSSSAPLLLSNPYLSKDVICSAALTRLRFLEGSNKGTSHTQSQEALRMSLRPPSPSNTHRCLCRNVGNQAERVLNGLPAAVRRNPNQPSKCVFGTTTKL